MRGTSQAAGNVFLSGSLLLSLLCLLKFLIFPSTRSGRAGAPTFWPAESRQRLAKEGCAPFGIPPLAVALECLRHNRARGVTELLAAYAAGASGRFAEASPQKPFRTRYHARARMIGKLSPMGNLRGQGGEAPTPKRWRCGGRGERARARAFPNGTEAPAAQAARSSARATAPARTWGFPKGGVQHPTLVRGFARG